MAEDKTIIMPDNQNNGWGNIPAVLALNGNGWGFGNNWGGGFGNGLFGGGGFLSGILGGILGGLIPGFIGGNGFGNWGGNGNGAAAASLGAQATANANTDLIIQAINGTDADVRLLATTLNSDIDSVRLAINTVQGAVANVASQTGLTGLQVINAIQAGNAELANQLCRCCCDQRQLTVEQGYQNQIRTIQQTETLGGAIADLKTTMVKEFCDAKERDMQEKINTLTANNALLRSEADNMRQTAAFSAMLAPIAKEVNDIRCAMPNTVPVVYPNITAVNNTPNFGWNNGFWGNGFGWNNGFVF